jgi:putative flippase GtrA
MPTFTSARIAQLARFCIVGLTCYTANILALAALCELLGMHYVVAYILVFFMGNALGYWLNKRFTFGVRTGLDRASMVRYQLVNLVMLAISTAALHVLVESAHVQYLAATAIVAAVNAPAGFMAHRLVTYRITT